MIFLSVVETHCGKKNTWHKKWLHRFLPLLNWLPWVWSYRSAALHLRGDCCNSIFLSSSLICLSYLDWRFIMSVWVNWATPTVICSFFPPRSTITQTCPPPWVYLHPSPVPLLLLCPLVFWQPLCPPLQTLLHILSTALWQLYPEGN